MDPGGRRRGLRVLADPEAGRAVPRPPERPQRPGRQAGDPPRGRRRRRPRPGVGDLADGRAREEDRGAGHPGRPVARPVDRGTGRPRDPALLAGARARLGGGARRLRPRLQLRLRQHHLVAHADHAAADGERSARGVRAPVRRRGQHRQRRAAGPAPRGPERARLRRRGGEGPPAVARRGRRRQARAVPRRGARRGAPGPDGRAPGRPGDAGLRAAGRHPRHVRGACQADVRPVGARLPDRSDARRHVHDRQGGQRPVIPGDRRAQRAPRRIASPERPAAARGAGEDQHVPHADVRLLPRADAEHAGRRRLAAGPHAAALRHGHQRRQPALPPRPADAGGGRRRGSAQGRAAPAVPRRHAAHEPVPLDKLGMPVERFGDSTGRIDYLTDV